MIHYSVLPSLSMMVLKNEDEFGNYLCLSGHGRLGLNGAGKCLLFGSKVLWALLEVVRI